MQTIKLTVGQFTKTFKVPRGSLYYLDNAVELVSMVDASWPAKPCNWRTLIESAKVDRDMSGSDPDGPLRQLPPVTHLLPLCRIMRKYNIELI